MGKYSLAYGQLAAALTFEQLGLIFCAMQVQLRESSHYTGGEYLVLRDANDSRITFEKVAFNEHLLRGEAATDAELLGIVQQASAALTAAQVRHSIELYDAQDALFGYLHYQWPAAPLT